MKYVRTEHLSISNHEPDQTKHFNILNALSSIW